MPWILGTVGEHAVTEPAYCGTHYVQLVFNLCIFTQPFVLQDHRNIILPPGFRQRQLAALVVFQQNQPRQTHHHLLAGLAVSMRMEPAGGCGLFDLELHPARGTWLNQCLRAAINVTGDFQAVPVNGTGLRQAIANIHRHRFAALQSHRRPQ
ncbi:hypothetical protein D3C78_965930 [compost metagenome]